jgi:hypothetical protein
VNCHALHATSDETRWQAATDGERARGGRCWQTTSGPTTGHNSHYNRDNPLYCGRLTHATNDSLGIAVACRVLELHDHTPVIVVEIRLSQCAGLNRHEVEDERALRERSSDPLGLESCAATARDPAKRRQRYRRGGYSAPKTVEPDADALEMRGRQHERRR